MLPVLGYENDLRDEVSAAARSTSRLSPRRRKSKLNHCSRALMPLRRAAMMTTPDKRLIVLGRIDTHCRFVDYADLDAMSGRKYA